MSDIQEESKVIRKQPCPVCKEQGGDYKGDNMNVYSDGHAYCFACGTYWKNAEQQTDNEKPEEDWLIHQPTSLVFTDGTCQGIPTRKLTLETCKIFDYRCGKTDKGEPVQMAHYQGQHGETGIHYRTKDKKFWWTGSLQHPQLFGQHLWRAGGRKLIITEGELDCMSISQIQGNKWPVVSLPSGAAGAVKAIKDNLEFVESFKEVILAFDMDEAGRKAVDAVAPLLTPGKAYILNIPLKDASDMLQAGKADTLIAAIWQAAPYRPDGIINGDQLYEAILKEPDQGFQVNIPKLCEATRGIHPGKLLLLTAGSGIGKSTIAHEIAYELLIKYQQTIGILALEENPKRVADRYIGIYLNKPVHLDHHGVTESELKEAFKATLGTGRLWIYDHYGSQEADVLMSKIRYMAISLKCDFILLDHISIAISGLDEIIKGDERKLIDILMTKLRSLVEETGVGIIAVCHLKNPPQGKSYSKGLEVDLNALRGSGTLSQIPDFVVALERDQQGKHPNYARIRILKNRHTGICGIMDTMYYDQDTGRLLATEEDCPFSQDDQSDNETELKGAF
jgi:twinkle protein